MPHDYNQSSDFEKIWQPIADNFYISKYPTCVIKRYDSNSIEDLEFQKKDIDLTLILEDRKIHISEKFRKEEYGDCLIELYCKYPLKKGWMEDNESDFLAYFSPCNVRTMNMKSLLLWFHSQNIYEKLEIEIQKLNANNLNKSSRVKLNYKTSTQNPIELNVIQAFNKTKNTTWYTISTAIKWEDLKKDGLNVKEFII